jgi:hypothetical protein
MNEHQLVDSSVTATINAPIMQFGRVRQRLLSLNSMKEMTPALQFNAQTENLQNRVKPLKLFT